MNIEPRLGGIRDIVGSHFLLGAVEQQDGSLINPRLRQHAREIKPGMVEISTIADIEKLVLPPVPDPESD